MNLSTDLLKAPHMGVRELKQSLSSKLLEGPLVITDHGVPISINLPYEEVLELLDIFDELSDVQTLKLIENGRCAVRSQNKGIPVSRLFSRMRKNKK